jgi:hypothetical protein
MELDPQEVAYVPDNETPDGITGVSYAGTSFRVLQAGIDQIEIRLNLEGSDVHARIEKWDSRPAGYGRVRLGSHGSFGKWEPLLGRTIMWKADTKRLWVDLHPHEPGKLLPLKKTWSAVADILEKLAVVGIVSYEEAAVTRADVTVDVLCESADLGRSLMLAVAGARLDRGRSVHAPYADLRAVEMRGKGKGPKQAIVYDKALERGYEKLGRNRWLRFEARKFWKGHEAPILREMTADDLRNIWLERFSGLNGGRATTGGIAMTVTELVRNGELAALDAERLLAFLEFESLGVAEEVYPPRLLRDRRALARKHGVAVSGPGEGEGAGVSLDLAALLGEWSGSLKT